MKSRIIGTGSSCPAYVMTNDDLSRIVETSDEWIKTRTGIERRHVSDKENQNAGVDMACEAAEKALDMAGLNAAEIDMIIVATSSSDAIYPNTASMVQKAIGAVNASGYDLNAACSGFLFALNAADAFINTGRFKNILVIGAEVMSRRLDWADRNTCVLFGDGAGAAIITADDSDGIEGIVMHGDGSRGEVLACTEKQHITMNGQEVFKFAVKKVPESIEEVLEQCGWRIDEIKHFILHQANVRIIQSVAKRLQIDNEKFPTNLSEYGNTSAASIPILLDELNREGKIQKGDRMVISGFGAGLSWGATALTW